MTNFPKLLANHPEKSSAWESCENKDLSCYTDYFDSRVMWIVGAVCLVRHRLLPRVLHCLRGFDTAFALSFHCLRGFDTAFAFVVQLPSRLMQCLCLVIPRRSLDSWC